MGTNRSSESKEFAQYLRNARTVSAAEVTRRTLAHDADDFTASERAAYTLTESR